MLTPKEKAKELVDKYLYEIKGADRYNYNLESMNIFISKQCSKIAVDEILNINSVDKDYYLNDYWQEVKAEIDNI